MEEESETYNVVEVNTFSTDDDYMICACGECFNSDETLKKHLIEKHANGDNVAKEDGEEVAKPKEHVCEFCSKSYNNVRALNIHRTHAHLGTKKKSSIVCPECGRTCSSRLALENHIRTHTGEKPFICSVCSRGFNANLLLQMHTRIHTGEKPYVCRLCPKAFASRSGLTRHKRVHTGDKPYECEVCEKRFSQSNSCKLHYLTVHLKQPCPYKRKPRVKKPKTESYDEMDMYEAVESVEMNDTEVVDEVSEVVMDESEVVDEVSEVVMDDSEVLDAVTQIEMDEYAVDGEDEVTQYEIVETKVEEDEYGAEVIYETEDEIVTVKEEDVDHNYMTKIATKRGPARDSSVRKVVLVNNNLKQTNNESLMRQLVLVRKNSHALNSARETGGKRANLGNLKKGKTVVLKSGNIIKSLKANREFSPRKFNQQHKAVAIKIEKPDETINAAQFNVPSIKTEKSEHKKLLLNQIKVEKPVQKKIILNQKNFVPITMVDNKPLYVLKRGRLHQEAQKVVVLKNNAVVLQQSVKPTFQLKSLPILRKAVPLKQHPHNLIKLK